MSAIVPIARSLYLCDYHVGYPNGKVDLYGTFKAIRPASYPYMKGPFVCFAQLTNGLGEMTIHFDIRRSSDMSLVDWSGPRTLRFPNRDVLVQVVYTFPGCTFPEHGLYLVELHCDNTWVADTVLHLREVPA